MHVTYSEEIEDLSKERKEAEEKRLEERQEELSKIKTEFIRIETKFITSCEKLKSSGKQEAIHASQIKGNYKVRREEIEQEKSEGIKKQKEFAEQNRIMQTQINNIERKIDIKTINDNNEFNYQQN